MRNTRAKQLKRIARSRTIGAPDIVYIPAIVKPVHSPGCVYEKKLEPTCTRAVYQKLKAEYVRGV